MLSSILSIRFRLLASHSAGCILLLLSAFCIKLNAQTLDPPTNVHALVYSSSAIELFFTPTEATTVEILRNDSSLGVTDARSLFEAGLDSSLNYRYELRSVNEEGQRSIAVVIEATTGNFQLPVKRIDAVLAETSAVLIESDPPVLPQTNAESLPGDEPETPPAAAADAQPDTLADVLPEPLSDSSAEADLQPEVLPTLAGACNVSSIADLRTCLDSSSSGSTVFVRQNLQCNGGDCCSSGQAMVQLRNARNVTLLGNGKRLLRTTSQRQCSLLEVINSSNITFDRWHLDDDISVQSCQVSDFCPYMVHVRNSDNVSFTGGSISHGKGYTVYVNNVDGFNFTNSALINSGVLGMYLGHDSTPSRNIAITDSVFRDNQTNALALLGVTGTVASNRISNNLFLRNHRLGQWQVAPQYGTGFTGGGQMYIAKANGVTIENNRIADGYCSNCFVQQRARSGVSGLELGEPGKNTIANLTITGNTIVNHDGAGIYANVGTTVPSSISIDNNQLINNVQGIQHVTAAIANGNRSSDTQRFESFESDSFSSTYDLRTCGTASIQRVCGDGKSHFGQCRIQLHADQGSCAANSATMIGPALSVQPFQQIHANAWIAGYTGSWCFEFLNSAGTPVNRTCQSFDAADRSEVLRFVGAPALDAIAPDGSVSARLIVQTEGAGVNLDIDDIQLGGF